MTNKEIVRKLKWLLLLVELHQPEHELLHFLPQQLLKLEKIQKPLESFTETDWEENGLNENVVDFVVQLVENHSLPLLEELQEQTPSGVLDMLKLRGLGAKKVRTLWKDLAIENLEELKKVALEGKITTLKGFGEKTQETILAQIDFFEKNAHKLLFADAERYAMRIIRHLYEHVPDIRIELCGELRRNCEVISCIELLISTAEVPLAFALIDELGDFSHNYQQSGVFVWRGMVKDNGCRVVVRAVELQRFANYLFSFSANHRHLSTVVGIKTLYEYAQEQAYSSEEKIYEAAGLPFIAPELREGYEEIEWAKQRRLPQLVEMKDLKGILHNHTTYSDGMHSLEEMATYCKELGYEYVGITDHSQSAYYANGLRIETIYEQHREIEALNKKLAPFRIFKGIESDILADGSLDYPAEILQLFDFVIASIHSGLSMTKEKATERLIRAIENPYTSILGHPTGRLLLKREGYPIDHRAVIEACATHRVAIEINGNPERLDLDWRWVRYAIEKGVMIALNPDAHEKEAYSHTRYALLVARKAGLTKEMTLNHFNTAQISAYFQQKKVFSRVL